MQLFKHLLTLGLGGLAIWGSPLAPVAENSKRCIDDQPTSTLHRRVVPNTIPVAPWKNIGTGSETHATYIAKMSTGIVGDPTHADLALYAERAYASMMSQKPRVKNTNLIAALFIPTTRSIYISSVPDGPGIGKINNDGATAAPAWWSQVRNRNPARVLHAEDGAAFLYESSLGTKLAPGATYPAGSFVAVYGVINGEKTRSPCTDANNLDPPCGTVMANLGIAVM